MTNHDTFPEKPLCITGDQMTAGVVEVIQPYVSDAMAAGLQDEEQAAELLGDVPERRIASFRPEQIQIRGRARALNKERVEALIESIEAIGLRSPITVRIIPQVASDGAEDGGDPILVTGLHCLEAVKSLEIERIDCLIEPGSELDAQLWEIDENLRRAELTELERAEHLRQRKAIYEELHPQSRHGGLPEAPGGGKAKTANVAGFATDTAIKTGIAERTIRRDIRRAKNIDKPAAATSAGIQCLG
jgi:hypothetical protein